MRKGNQPLSPWYGSANTGRIIIKIYGICATASPMKDNGSLAGEDGTTSPLSRLFLTRRSVRKYEKGAASQQQVAYVEHCARSFASAMGFRSARLHVVGQGEQRDAIVRAAVSGVIGKVNPWLPFSHARHLILCGAVLPDDASRNHVQRAIKEASMVMQVALLAATEQGLGTCWMAGIHHDRVESTFPMPDGARLIAMSPLGLPPARLTLSWDTLSHYLVSKRRKPLEQLWMHERWGVKG
ncbi:MAG TPA: nitroreductase family protein [Polyangiaceae bacterium]|mgnify:CR=1 FL=1|nr:MAG: Nitroreductase family protein [Deltaproteobacteria bacterium ADurb.Bin207]HNS98612.1 nitroreductase family protein [Polyangiaceae bacterium]HNZ24659.1 nitroreductase family protein [Polyangiaceae bacterium]HOD23460.1 nitroreductase family protein [Polyangiaceae bacterium]HOE51926.1 nitroreductase family protein [Polyangiaceae bacterium]